jgi:hypothetical protein
MNAFDQFVLTHRRALIWGLGSLAIVLALIASWGGVDSGTDRLSPERPAMSLRDDLRRIAMYQENPIDWRARAEAAESKLATLEQERDEARAAVVCLKELHATPGAMMARLEGEGARAFQMMVSEFFVLQGGKNYVEWQVGQTADIETTDFVITCQKKTGKTPNELKLEAETKLATAEARIAELQQQLTFWKNASNDTHNNWQADLDRLNARIAGLESSHVSDQDKEQAINHVAVAVLTRAARDYQRHMATARALLKLRTEP